MHPLNLRSPLHGASPESLRADQSSMLVSITGFDETFTQTVHARHVYHVDDMRRGARFADILEPAPDGRWIIDYTRFDDIIEAPKAAGDGTNLDPS
jgi:inward rectifier potassium channel